jgi:hypothetical protein
MYDEYSYDSKEDDRYYEPPPSRKGRDRERGPPPPEDYDERDYEQAPPPRRGGPPRGPPPRPAKYKPPRGPNQIPGMISIFVIVGILLMFIGITIMTFATPTSPPPEIPKEGESDSDYLEEYAEWQRDYSNAYRMKELLKQIGIVIHDLGAMLAGIALLGGGLMLSNLDMKLRTTMIISGIVLVVIMFIIPLSWNFISIPSSL